MAEITIWHNPRCAKSRETLKLLESEGETLQIVRYLETSPDMDEIRRVLKMLGIGARELMRTKEAIYKELNLKTVDDEEALIKAMAENPRLIERPVVIQDNKAVIGRPPEKVLEIIKNQA